MKNLKRIIVFIIITSLGLIIINFFNHALFHFCAELFTIFIGFMMFIMAINTKGYSERNILLSFGIAYLYIGTLDFLHLITYGDINIIETTIHMSKSFWVSARLLEAANVLIIFTLYQQKHKTNELLSHITQFAYVLLAFLFIYFNLAPSNVELSSLRIIEHIISFVIISFFIFGLIISSKVNLEKEHKVFIKFAIVLKIISVFLNMSYFTDFVFLSVISNILMLISYTAFYFVFVQATLKNPYSNVFSMFKAKQDRLIKLSETDSLTGIFNHSVTHKKIEALVGKYENKVEQIFVTMIDIDDFKKVNDKYGHQKGDEILITFANILSKVNYKEKIVGRYGGDEFVVAGVRTTTDDFDDRFVDVSEKLHIACLELDMEVTFSAGVALCHKGDITKDLIYKADIKMYESKRLGKNRVTIWK